MEDNKKIFILDTNVLIHDPEALYSFDNEIVGIPVKVLEELDRFKGESSQKGFNVRKVIRHLDLLRGRGSLSAGVKLDNGGILQVFLPPNLKECQIPLIDNSPDNEILYTAYCLKQKGRQVLFISKDINLRVKADVVGIEALDYLRDTITKDEFYKGWITLKVPSVQLKREFPEELNELLTGSYQLTVNEYILLESQHNPHNYALWRYQGNKKFKKINVPPLKWPLQPRNAQQLMALDVLLDNDIQLATLIGPAGTGKTFLALLAALHKVLIDHEYEKILISRPVIPLGPDIGYLPGDVKEKLHSWMQPIYDNMDFITHSINAGSHSAIARPEDGDKDSHARRAHRRKPHKERGMPTLDDLIKENKISLEAITYMRGRSIPYQYILIDEVQNLTPHEVKTLISRVGEGSKIVLAGDPYQIDSPYLDFTSNGLVVASDKFKGQSLFASVFLESSERSELSKLASELL